MAITIAPEAINTARDCQKVRLPAKKARYNTMKASQPKNATTVPATLALILSMILDLSSAKLIRFTYALFSALPKFASKTVMALFVRLSPILRLFGVRVIGLRIVPTLFFPIRRNREVLEAVRGFP